MKANATKVLKTRRLIFSSCTKTWLCFSDELLFATQLQAVVWLQPNSIRQQPLHRTLIFFVWGVTFRPVNSGCLLVSSQLIIAVGRKLRWFFPGACVALSCYSVCTYSSSFSHSLTSLTLIFHQKKLNELNCTTRNLGCLKTRQNWKNIIVSTKTL